MSLSTHSRFPRSSAAPGPLSSPLTRPQSSLRAFGQWTTIGEICGFSTLVAESGTGTLKGSVYAEVNSACSGVRWCFLRLLPAYCVIAQCLAHRLRRLALDESGSCASSKGTPQAQPLAPLARVFTRLWCGSGNVRSRWPVWPTRYGPYSSAEACRPCL